MDGKGDLVEQLWMDSDILTYISSIKNLWPDDGLIEENAVTCSQLQTTPFNK
jgi:hypothetical protein